MSQRIVVENQTLLQNPFQTFLTSDLASGSGSATVKNITGFAVNQVIVLGEIGNEGTELIKTHASTAPTGSTITFASNTQFPHSSGTPLYVIDYDQVEFSNAGTITGTKTVISTISLQVDSLNTVYDNTTGSLGYYFVRFKNTISTTYSDYSDSVPTGGYPINSARQIINNALGMINKETSELLTDTFAFNEINNCQMEVLREYKRWSFMQVFDYDLGQLQTGQWRIAVPTDLDDQFTNKSIYNFKIGTYSNLTWVDKEKWNDIIEGVAHTTLASNINVSDPTITLTDASNLNQGGGTLYVGANTYGYSSITGNVATLNSVSTTTNTAGTDVFQGATLGLPAYWTIFGGYLYFYPVLAGTYNLRDGILDYYKAPISITNDSDLVVLADPTVIQYYLAWKMLLRINSGVEDAGCLAMKNEYIDRRENLKRKEVIGRTVRMRPLINSIDERNDVDNKTVRTGAFPNSFY